MPIRGVFCRLGGCIILSGPAAKRLIRSGDGDAALLYIAVLKNRGSADDEKIRAQLGWNPDKFRRALHAPWGLDRSYANSRRFLPTWRMNHTVAFQQPMPPKRSSAPVSAAIGNATSGGAVQPPSCMVTQGTSIPAKDISRDNNAAAGISAPLSRNTTASMLVVGSIE